MNLMNVLPACQRHPAADACSIVLLALDRDGSVVGRGTVLDDFHRWPPSHRAHSQARGRLDRVNASAQCMHGFFEDCLNCSECGSCSESLDARDHCWRCDTSSDPRQRD